MAVFNRLDSTLQHQPQLATQALLGQRGPDADNNYCSKGSITNNAEESETRQRGPSGKEGSIRDLFSSAVMLKRSVILFYIW